MKFTLGDASAFVAVLGGLWAALKVAVKVHNTIAASVTAPIMAKMDEQIEAGKVRDQKMDELTAAVQEVQKEVTPNGGGSMKDEIRAILSRVDTSIARFLAFNEDAEVGQFITDCHGRCTWVNRTYCRITGRTDSEVLGWGWLSSILENERDSVHEEWEATVAEERNYERVQHYVRPDGEIVAAAVKARPITNAQGKVIEFVGFVCVLEEAPHA